VPRSGETAGIDRSVEPCAAGGPAPFGPGELVTHSFADIPETTLKEAAAARAGEPVVVDGAVALVPGEPPVACFDRDAATVRGCDGLPVDTDAPVPADVPPAVVEGRFLASVGATGVADLVFFEGYSGLE
jgi:hypothetical protein